MTLRNKIVALIAGAALAAVALAGADVSAQETFPNKPINITVTSADPNAVVAALQRYVRMSGPVPVTTRPL